MTTVERIEVHPGVRAMARKECEARVKRLLADFRIPKETTDIVVALIRQALK